MKTTYILGKIDAKLNILIDNQQKVILALIAIVGATLGLKFVGTPPLQILLFYIKTFIFLFTILISWSKRKIIKGWYFLFAFGIFAGVAQILNIVCHGETIWSTLSFLMCNIMLLLFIWYWSDNFR